MSKLWWWKCDDQILMVKIWSSKCDGQHSIIKFWWSTFDHQHLSVKIWWSNVDRQNWMIISILTGWPKTCTQCWSSTFGALPLIVRTYQWRSESFQIHSSGAKVALFHFYTKRCFRMDSEELTQKSNALLLALEVDTARAPGWRRMGRCH